MFALAALGATNGGSIDKAALPPFSNAYEPHSVEERGVWQQADEDERRLRDAPMVIHDQALTAYVRGVLCRTVGTDRCAGARVYVVRAASFNASMAPNGMVVVYSGLLLRVRDEAELASILGHEFAHFEQRHSLKEYKHRRSMLGLIAWMSVVGGATGASVSSAATGSIFSFNRDQEREADMLGGRYAAVSGYDPHAAAGVWQRAMDEADATALGRRQHSHGYDNVAFFADHPTDLERAGYMRKMAEGLGPGDAGEAPFVAAMKPWRVDFLADQLKLNDFGGTEYLLAQLAGDHWTEDLLFARAELFRLRGNPRDLVTAAGLYRDAIALEPGRAESYRGLGLALMRGGDAAAGGDALKHYLVLKPQASDAAMITTLLPS